MIIMSSAERQRLYRCRKTLAVLMYLDLIELMFDEGHSVPHAEFVFYQEVVRWF